MENTEQVDITQAVSGAQAATIPWLITHAVDMKVPGLGMPISRASRQHMRSLHEVSWLLGHDAAKKMTPLFIKGEKDVRFVGVAVGDTDINTTLRSLGLTPDAIMPNGERRYGIDSILQLKRKAEKLEPVGKPK